MQLAQVETFRYPDEPRYFYPAAVVESQPHRLMLFSPARSPVWNGRTGEVWRSTNHGLDILYDDRDYNIIVFWNADWSFSAYYVNIALPARWDDTYRVSYVDLDLDVLLVTEESNRVGHTHAERGIHELDRDEFEERQIEFGYPPEVVARAEAALVEVKAQMAAQAFPFDNSLLNFRPDPTTDALADFADDLTTWYRQDGDGQPQIVN